MPVVLVRPYPVERLRAVPQAIADAAGGDMAGLQALYRDAVTALEALDPEEVEDLRREYARAVTSDKVLVRAALDVSETWEGTVVVGALLADPARFRGYAWLAAQVRYELSPHLRDVEGFRAYASGAGLPSTSPEDAALYAAVPALVGLGPEFPEELEEPVPLDGDPVWRLLGLPDVEGVDPLDGLAVSPEECRARCPGLRGPWRELVGRCLESGVLIRPG